MTTFNVRFNLSPAGSGSMQNAARCVAVSATTAEAAAFRVHEHYAKKGRSPRVYAVQVGGVWRKAEFGRINSGQTIVGTLPVEGYSIGDAFGSEPKEIPVETPEWAA